MSDAPTFADNINQQLLDTPKSTHGQYDLPCGFLDVDGTLHATVHLREMTGREEDLMASNKLSPQRKINALVTNCLVSIGTISDRNRFAEIVPQLPIGDRVFLLLALRRTSLGDEYPVEEECPNCKVKSHYLLNLGDLETKPMADPKKRVSEVTLPSGKKVRFRIGMGVDEERVAKVPDEEKPSTLLLCRTELLDGKVPTMMDIKALSWRDRQVLRAAFDDNDGGVDTSLDYTCPACSTDFKKDLDMGQQGFFFPHQVQKAWKTKSST